MQISREVIPPEVTRGDLKVVGERFQGLEGEVLNLNRLMGESIEGFGQLGGQLLHSIGEARVLAGQCQMLSDGLEEGRTQFLEFKDENIAAY